eukprot:6199402-Pleurochrysis_carterae.AAC.2
MRCSYTAKDVPYANNKSNSHCKLHLQTYKQLKTTSVWVAFIRFFNLFEKLKCGLLSAVQTS